MHGDYLRHCHRCSYGKNDDEVFVKASRQILWRDVAVRLRDLAAINGGIYVKAGQHICVQPAGPSRRKPGIRALH